ncbi:succinyl-CoA synthetase alpha subunit [Desulfonatronum thiosulfatophilum]|uniref:Succinyl-CoA synthetase alpha subunit n=1 Tax=Desulfonatronum thiosulfatophilum TaxID=617002 RepID=A0A1G6DXF2_9BACT|nr:succinate--CoA ligase subunit alpha [Desulfonatronum thiosulfatophilum]SDB49826.1 succinyl-CoA synthetase alpha subunit [Desulfonatronum thiosulfatophilum]
MQLNEHDSKTLFQESGIATPQGILLQRDLMVNPAADMSAENFSVPLPWMLKIQVLAGGRGKQGGVVALDSPEELPTAAQRLFELEVNARPAPFLRLEHRATIAREFYLSLSLQREWGCPVLTIGRQGGVEVETIGAEDPENLLVQRLNALAGLGAHQVRAAFFHLGLDKSLWPDFHSLLKNLWDCFTNNGLLLAEINPLVLTREDKWLALDGKIEVDDNFADLRPEVKRFAREVYFSDQENRAKAAGLSYHRFEGRVGLMVNGAGLAMATMDLLNHSGLQPANFLDLGGGAGQQAMDEAMNILLGDPQVEAVLINLFGGILSCEKVAMALMTALGGQAPVKPLVVRFSGHGADAGRSLLSDVPGKTLHLADDLNQALDILRDILQADSTPSGKLPRSSAPGADSVSKKSSGANRSPRAGSLVAQPFGLDRTSQVLVQGLTGREGRRHAELMREYGVQIVAGVTPFKEGENVLGLPVYSSVAQAAARHHIDASIIFVPASVAADAVLEAAQANVPWIICITEGIPQMEMLTVLEQLKGSNSRLIGPNTPGLIVPGEIKIGIMPGGIFSPGPVAVLSRSGTLTYEAVHRLGAAGIGQSVCIGVGGDPYVGLGLKACAELVVADPRTKALLILGEIGGRAEEETAEHLRAQGWTGPILAFIAGRTAPEGKRLGHAGAILEKGGGGIQAKLDRLQTAGVTLCSDLDDVARLTGEALDLI